MWDYTWNTHNLARKLNAGGTFQWVLESYSDADWSSNKATTRSTSCGVHYINGCFMYASSRSQKVVSLSSCESELHSLISCAVFVLGDQLEHIVYTDSSSARQLAWRQGARKVRHLSGKLLWIQEKTADVSFSVTPGTYSKQRCRYRYKEVEQAKVILPSV